MPVVSRSLPTTTKAGRWGSKRRAMPRAGIMPTVCNVSSSRTGCKSTTVRSCRRWKRRESGSVWKRTRSGKPEMQWTIRFRWNGKSFFSSPHRSVCGKTPRTGQNECTQAWTSDVTTAMQCWRRNKAARSSLSETNRSRWNTPVRTAAKYSVPTKTSARYS